MKKAVIKSLSVATIALVSIVATSCGESREGWTVKGSIPVQDKTTLFIEVPRGTSWAILDSLTTEADGQFEYVAVDAAKAQDIYRINTGDTYIYFPVEGADVVTVTPTGKTAKDGFKLTGTAAAEGFSRADSLINTTVKKSVSTPQSTTRQCLPICAT